MASRLTDSGSGYGYSYGYSSGSGSGFGLGFGLGLGYAYGSGSGYGDGDGSGYGDGDGSGYGTILGTIGIHDVYVTPWGIAVGCELHSVEDWRLNWAEIARHHYVEITESEADKWLAKMDRASSTRAFDDVSRGGKSK